MHVTILGILIHHGTMSNMNNNDIKEAAAELRKSIDDHILDSILHQSSSGITTTTSPAVPPYVRGVTKEELDEMIQRPIHNITPTTINFAGHNVNVGKYKTVSFFYTDLKYWTTISPTREHHPVPLHTLPPNGLAL